MRSGSTHSRSIGRLQQFVRALPTLARRAKEPPTPIARILVAHHLLLGDSLMLAPLLARLRQRFPGAEIVTTLAPAYLPLFAGEPYGVKALGYDPRDAATLAPLFACAGKRGFDLGVVPGENRYALLARALGARWIVAYAGDRPPWKNWLCDELIGWPNEPQALADLFARLAGDAPPTTYRRGDWPAPVLSPAATHELPAAANYAVLHLGAGSPLRHWATEKWQALAQWLSTVGVTPVWSAGPGEEALVVAVDPDARCFSCAGKLDLTGMWHLLARARLLVCPDTGIAHLAKLTLTPTVCLFGPGSQTLFGKGEFWRDAPFVGVTVADFPCRDQRKLFKRDIAWVRRCQRSTAQCDDARCMAAIDIDRVIDAAGKLLNATE
jgi:ADP-heptose:LPS heptosyltransferase